jgi:hypothetical protein
MDPITVLITDPITDLITDPITYDYGPESSITDQIMDPIMVPITDPIWASIVEMVENIFISAQIFVAIWLMATW